MMNTEELLAAAGALLEPWTVEKTTPEEGRVDIVVEADHLIEAVTALVNAKWGYLSALTGLDLGPEAGRMEALYHFCHYAAVLTLRVRLGRETPVLPTVCGVIPSTSFFERELSEMFGITVEGTPNTDHLFLPDNWPTDTYPLRKDFDASALRAQDENRG